jgi:hypothetical protein
VRDVVDGKFEYAMNQMTVLMLEGKVEIKKASEVFGKNEFSDSSFGLKTYQFDPLTGKKKFFNYDDYYFFLTCDEAEGKITELEESITNPKRRW